MRLSLVGRLTFVVVAIIGLSFVAWAIVVHRSTRTTFVEMESETRVRSVEPSVRFGLVEREEQIVTRTRAPDDGAAFAWTLWQSAVWWLTGVLVVAVAATVWVMRRALRPIGHLVHAARDLHAGRRPERWRGGGPSEFIELADAFDEAAEAIAGTERLRRQVIADVGHELRTPVTNLKAQLEAMQQQLIAPDRAGLASLQNEVRLLERLVDDFQQLTLADAGRLSLNLQVVPVRATIASLIAPQADAAGAAWRVNGATDVCAIADEERLRQVIANLMDNAVRHRPAGLEIDVHVRPIHDGTAVFVFRDNGPGVAAEDVPRIFDRFYRGEKSRSRETGGSGLGLAIARGLVEAMGGTISYADTKETGAAFVVTLPRAACD